MVGPVGIDHADLGDGGIALFGKEIVTAECNIIRVHSKTELCDHIVKLAKNEEIEITLVGLCTDICVVSNAMLIKAALPEIEVSVVADACAGVTPDTAGTEPIVKVTFSLGHSLIILVNDISLYSFAVATTELALAPTIGVPFSFNAISTCPASALVTLALNVTLYTFD